jgi:hypothetical protein
VRIVGILLVLVMLSSSSFFGALPDIEKPDFTRSRSVIQSMDKMRRELQKASAEGVLRGSSAETTIDTCYKHVTTIRSEVVRGKYVPEIGRTFWSECHELYKDVY